MEPPRDDPQGSTPDWRVLGDSMNNELEALRNLTQATYKLAEIIKRPLADGAELSQVLYGIVEPALEAAADVLTEHQIGIEQEEQNS